MVLKFISKFYNKSKNNTLIIGETGCGKSWLAEAYLKHYPTEEKTIVVNYLYGSIFPDDCHFLSSNFRSKYMIDISRDKNYLIKVNNSGLIILDNINSLAYNQAEKIFPLLFALLDNPSKKVIILSQVCSNLFDEIPLTRFFSNIIVGRLTNSSLQYCPLKNFTSIHLSTSFTDNLESK